MPDHPDLNIKQFIMGKRVVSTVGEWTMSDMLPWALADALRAKYFGGYSSYWPSDDESKAYLLYGPLLNHAEPPVYETATFGIDVRGHVHFGDEYYMGRASTREQAMQLHAEAVAEAEADLVRNRWIVIAAITGVMAAIIGVLL